MENETIYLTAPAPRETPQRADTAPKAVPQAPVGTDAPGVFGQADAHTQKGVSLSADINRTSLQAVPPTPQTADATQTTPQAGSAPLRDTLAGTLIGLVRCTDSSAPLQPATAAMMLEGLCAVRETAHTADAALHQLLKNVQAEKVRLAPDCAVCAHPCGRSANYNMAQLYAENTDTRTLKLALLDALCAMAAALYPALLQGRWNDAANEFCRTVLFNLGETLAPAQLRPLCAEATEQLKCMQ